MLSSSRRIRFPAAVAAALLLVAAAAPGQQALPLQGPEAIWQSSCAYCHEKGVTHPILGTHLPVAAITRIVRAGIGAMPAFHPSEISASQLQELSRWVNEHPAPEASGGRSP
jgi:mono/diheme cytochrome c family protein